MKTASKRKPVRAIQRRKTREMAVSARNRAIVARPTVSEAIEQVLLSGNLVNLTTDQRLEYYSKVCQSLGLNPLTRPFEYISFDGKLQLYARKDCTEQLRKIHGIAITESSGNHEDTLYIVRVKAQDRTGRTDTGTGVVDLANLKGKDRANAIMKAETKAKRRATLSMAGLGFLDESELDTVGDYGTLTPGGRIMTVQPIEDANPHLDKFKEREQEQLAKLNAPQRQYVEDKKAAAKAKEPLMDVEYLDPAKSECGECHSSFGVHLMKCSKFRDPHAAKPIDALFYTLTPSGTYTIDGPQPLKTANKDLLTPLWNGAEKAIIATPEQLGKLISQLEKRHVPFKELQTAREPGSE